MTVIVHWYLKVNFSFSKIKVYLIYNIESVSGVQQSVSIIHIHGFSSGHVWMRELDCEES